jgi:hypothetical protein
MYLLMCREQLSGWQGCKVKLLCKSPCVILHFAGVLLSSQHRVYHNLRQNVPMIFGIVLYRQTLKRAFKTTVIKSCTLFLPGGSVDVGEMSGLGGCSVLLSLTCVLNRWNFSDVIL